MPRLPRPLTPSKGRAPSRAGQEDDERGLVFLHIAYDGLKGDQVDRIPLTPAAARVLAIHLLNTAELAERDAAVDVIVTRADMAEVRADVVQSNRSDCPPAGPARLIPIREA